MGTAGLSVTMERSISIDFTDIVLELEVGITLPKIDSGELKSFYIEIYIIQDPFQLSSISWSTWMSSWSISGLQASAWSSSQPSASS